MVPVKKNTATGVITFHTPFAVSQLNSQDCTTDVKDTTETRKSVLLSSARQRSTSGCIRAGVTIEESSSGPKLGSKQQWLSHTSLRQLQELESFLKQWDATQLRKRELLHKRWTERVWFPLQCRVEDHVSSCSLEKAKRCQSLYSEFLHQCNTKGFVFLETYDPKEYNPFLLSVKRPYYFKLNKDNIKDSLYLQQHERQEEKRTAPSGEAGCKYRKRHLMKLPHSDRSVIESVTPQANTPLQASFNYPASASRRTPVEDETAGRESSRLDTIPYHVRATATTDGRCHHTSCWFSRRACWQQPATLQLLKSLPASK